MNQSAVVGDLDAQQRHLDGLALVLKARHGIQIGNDLAAVLSWSSAHNCKSCPADSTMAQILITVTIPPDVTAELAEQYQDSLSAEVSQLMLAHCVELRIANWAGVILSKVDVPTNVAR